MHPLSLARLFPLALALVVTGCTPDSSPGDGGSDRDAQTSDDGGPDGSQNGGDAGDPDAGDPDGGDLETDAGPTTPCHGRAPSCFLRGFEACQIGLGCTVDPICLGTTWACPGLDQPNCALIMGCTWANDRCNGGQTPCAQLEDDVCEMQPGCALGTRCLGTITQCAAIPDQTTCLSQAGCSWTEPTPAP